MTTPTITIVTDATVAVGQSMRVPFPGPLERVTRTLFVWSER
jgi:hypothetical protein